ncbi:MAG: PDDEXK nuclease domain-containing protein [Thermoleophilia bacterium]|jgi:predicted nuclease of restriction endonuclease-like (RecB) superfamily
MNDKTPDGAAVNGYGNLLGDIKERIRSAQYAALRAVNRELIGLYWDIGRMIVERQAREKWGKAVVEKLAADLQAEFPGIMGFSSSNLWRMRVFFEAYAENEKLAPLAREIGWTHNYVIFEKCKDDLQREFYIRMTRKFGWTKPVLIHQIDNQTYEKILLNQVNFDKTLPAKVRNRAKLAVKDEYTFDFLELGEEFSERELERAAIARIEEFLRQMGGVFAFVGSQHRLEIEGEEFFIDILLYHRALKCLVAVELKVGKFLPEYVGKMQFYLAVLDDTVRMDGENPAIGIVLCKEKNRTVVEYALRDSGKPIGVASYRMVSALPDELQGQLPGPEQVALLMEEI